MFAAARRSALANVASRAFSTTPSRSDVARLILVGRLGKEPEVRTTRTEKEYIVYHVATTDYSPPSTNSEDARPQARTTWHSVLSFNPSSNDYLRTLQKGSQVYVEANYELREADPSADPDTPAGQRQIFLRHSSLKVLSRPRPSTTEESSESE